MYMIFYSVYRLLRHDKSFLQENYVYIRSNYIQEGRIHRAAKKTRTYSKSVNHGSRNMVQEQYAILPYRTVQCIM